MCIEIRWDKRKWFFGVPLFLLRHSLYVYSVLFLFLLYCKILMSQFWVCLLLCAKYRTNKNQEAAPATRQYYRKRCHSDKSKRYGTPLRQANKVQWQQPELNPSNKIKAFRVEKRRHRNVEIASKVTTKLSEEHGTPLIYTYTF